MRISYTVECEDHEIIALMRESLRIVREVMTIAQAKRHADLDDTSCGEEPEEDSWPMDEWPDDVPKSEAKPQVARPDPRPEPRPAPPPLEEGEIEQNQPERIKLRSLDPFARQEAKDFFRDLCATWAVNFDEEGPQPDRGALMQELGSSPHLVAVLVMAYEKESLQALVVEALKASGWSKPGVDIWQFADKMSTVMVQVSHFGCPDLAGTYDYTTRWLRRKNA